MDRWVLSALVLVSSFASTAEASSPLFSKSGETLAIDAFDLPPGASVTIEFEVTIDDPVTAGATQVCNQGNVLSEDFAGSPRPAVPSDDPDTAAPNDPTCTQLLLQADLSVEKMDSPDPVEAGAPLSYTVSVNNLSATTATGVTVVDTLPAGVGFVSASGTGWMCGFVSPDVTCTRMSLAMGGAPPITINVTAPAEGGVITNVVTVSANEMDPVPGNNSDAENTTVTPRADLALTKTDGVTSAVPGEQLTYTIVVSNNGPSTDPSTQVADTFPGALACGWTSMAAGGATGNTNNAGPANLADTLSLPPGGSVTYTVTCDIDPAATGTLSNTAAVTGSIPDPVPGNNLATDADTTLTPQADLAVTKTDGVTSAVPGEQLTYTIVVSNDGPSTDPLAALADTFPATLSCGWTSVAAGGATGNTDNAGPANLGDVLSLPPGSSVTYTVTCDIAADATGTLVNTATATSSVTDPVPGNNSGTDADTVLAPEADLAISKTDGVTSAIAGQQLTYTIVVSNAGPSTDAAAMVADTFPGTLSCGWTSMAAGGATGNTNNAGPANLADTLSLPPGGSVTYTVTCDIASGATGTLSNTATVTASATDPMSGNNSATDDDTVLVAQADLAITKTDGVTSAVPGQQLVYTIVVSNGGPSTDPSVAVADTFPGVLSCGWTSMAAGGAMGSTNNAGPANLADTLSLPPGGSVSYTVTCDIAPGATGTLSNTATVTPSVSDPVPGNNSATDADTALTPQADLAVTKTDGVTSAVPGEQVTYTIVVSNAGPSTDPAASLGDTFPGTLSCGWTSLAAGGATGNTSNAGPANLAETLSLPPGSSVFYTVTCDIDAGATGTLSNTATATASVADPVPGNNSATDADTALTPQADLAVTKTDGVTSAVPGEQVTYTIVVSNAGPSTDPASSLADTFPATLSCGWTSLAAGGATGNTNNAGPANLAETLSLPPGSSVSYTVTCDIAASATGTLSNTATATASVADPVPGNNSATDADTMLTPQADLAVTKTDGVTSAVPGEQVIYTIVVSNDGPSTDPAAAVADSFPAVLSCGWTSLAAGGATGNTTNAGPANLADMLALPPGSSVTYTVTCDVDADATGMLSNTATVTASVTDLVPGNDSATDVDTLTPQADLAIDKTAVPPSGAVLAGEMVTYTITVTNDGPSTATGVVVTDVLPAGLIFQTTAGDCAEGAAAVPTCTLGTIAPGASKSYTIEVTVDSPAPTTTTNTATVAGNEPDPDPGDNSDEVTHSSDNVAPTVVALDTDPGDGALVSCETVRTSVYRLKVTFSEAMRVSGGIPGPSDADNPDNYALLGTGPDFDFDTDFCGTPQGDDVAVPISSVAYAADTPAAPQSTVTLHLGGSLPDGLYRFIACGSTTLEDAAGNVLDGDADGEGGDDYLLDLFRVDAGNLFANGHLDCVFAPWLEDPPAAAVHDPAADADGSPLSGSSSVPLTGGAIVSLEQCVSFASFAPGAILEIGGRFRLDAPASTSLGLMAGCDFANGAACGGAPAGSAADAELISGAPGIWGTSQTFELVLPPGALSGRCGLSFENPLGASYSAWLDQLFLRQSPQPIFADGFESGDTSAWSLSVP